MYVCICNAVTETEVRTEMAGGHLTVDAIAARTEATTGCGMCVERLCEMLDEYAEPSSGYPLGGTSLCRATRRSSSCSMSS